MREELGIRELRADLAAAVRRAGSGDRIVVTDRGRPVATLGPLEPAGSGVDLDDLVATGQVEGPRRHDRPPVGDAVDLPVDVRLDRVLDELRGR